MRKAGLARYPRSPRIQSIEVKVYIQADVTPTELRATRALADLLCGTLETGCQRVGELPLVLLPGEGHDVEGPSCEEGWELVYTINDEFRAHQLAKYMSLLGPVCGVIVKDGEMEQSVLNRWVEPLRGGDYIVFSQDIDSSSLLPEDLF